MTKRKFLLLWIRNEMLTLAPVLTTEAARAGIKKYYGATYPDRSVSNLHPSRIAWRNAVDRCEHDCAQLLYGLIKKCKS